MVDKRKPMPDARDRLDYVMNICRVPAKADFARWIGHKDPQRSGNWWGRNNIPVDGAKSIQKASGASLSWLLTDDGEPFPSGPTMYAPPNTAELDARLSSLEDGVGDVGAAIARVIRVLSGRMPGIAGELAAALRAIPAQAGARSPALEVVAGAAAEAHQLEEQAARVAVPRGSSGKLRHSGQ